MATSKIEFDLINDLCNECLDYLSSVNHQGNEIKKVEAGFEEDQINNIYEKIINKREIKVDIQTNETDLKFDHNINDEFVKPGSGIETIYNESDSEDGININFDKTNVDKSELIHQKSNENSIENESEGDYEEIRSDRLRKHSQQLPKIIITKTDGSNLYKIDETTSPEKWIKVPNVKKTPIKTKKRRITKEGNENVAHISNIPFEKLRLLNDTFHTLINLRWRWIVLSTVFVHFAIWLVFAVFWYIAALAHYDFDENPPPRPCVTGGKDFLNIFLASVEAQTTIGFGDRTIDEECPESIFLFIMQLIMGTGLSGVLTCVVYAKLVRPENFAKEGVGFSKNAVISMRDGQLCLMFRVWDLNYDHIIGTEIHAYFIRTSKTKEGEILKHYTTSLPLLQFQLMLWPITVVHVIDSKSPLYDMEPSDFINLQYEITVSLKGASASMGTFTQSQTSYIPREILWGYRFTSVVKYSNIEHKYTIDYSNLNSMINVDTPLCSGRRLSEALIEEENSRPATPSSFEEKVESLNRERPTLFSWKTDRTESSA